MSTINDIYADGIASGWKLINAATLTESRTFEADVVIVGSGAGGGTAAEILVEAGLTVLMLEEGALYTAADFKDMDEWRGYTTLYQEGGGRSDVINTLGGWLDPRGVDRVDFALHRYLGCGACR